MSETRGLLDEAIAHHSAGRLDAAEHIYRALLEMDTEDAETRHYFGLLALEKGWIEEGLGHLQRALEMAPETSRYWLGLAQGLLIAGQPEGAELVLDKAEAAGLDPSSTRDLRDLIATALRGHEGPATATLVDASVALDVAPDPVAPEAAAPAEPLESFRVALRCGLHLHVPPDIHCLTTYVLLEQGDWPDPALGFLRRYVHPGMLVLDVGAGYGVHALSIAQQLHGEGRVIALEPASAPRAFLGHGIADNGLDPVVTLIPCGLAERAGEAEIGLDAQGAVTRRGVGVTRERVTMLTLDELGRHQGYPAASRVDLLRLDVAVDAAAILRSGSAFFGAQDPLVVIGLDAGEPLDPDLAANLAGLGMGLYRAIPDLGLLVPVEAVRADEDLDRQRSLFACREGIAARLRQADALM